MQYLYKKTILLLFVLYLNVVYSLIIILYNLFYFVCLSLFIISQVGHAHDGVSLVLSCIFTFFLWFFRFSIFRGIVFQQ